MDANAQTVPVHVIVHNHAGPNGQITVQDDGEGNLIINIVRADNADA